MTNIHDNNLGPQIQPFLIANGGIQVLLGERLYIIKQLQEGGFIIARLNDNGSYYEFTVNHGQIHAAIISPIDIDGDIKPLHESYDPTEQDIAGVQGAINVFLLGE